jgi:hypothetical protein
VVPLMQTYRAALKEYGRTPMDFPITVEWYGRHRYRDFFSAPIEEVSFAMDSPVEEEGFEPSVPRMRDPPFQSSSGAQ